MSEQDEWKIAWRDAVPTPLSVVAYADDRFAFERHLLDWMRTRIEPGADPRRSWSPERGRTPRPMFEARAIGTVLPCYGSLESIHRIFVPAAIRYVPEDVARWRDPDHRAALIARAHAHAALVPGNRATMETER
jgi:hypothetical protein